jgi:hypothetical protein
MHRAMKLLLLAAGTGYTDDIATARQSQVEALRDARIISAEGSLPRLRNGDPRS